MRKFRTAVIGCGKVGEFHAEAYAKSEYSDFTAVYARSYDKAKRLADKYGVKPYTDIETMIRESGVEVVSICTPHPAHADPAVTAAKCGAHVLCEKPLATTLEDCDRILNAAKEAGVQVGTICQRRFYEPCMRVHRAIEDGKIGTPIIGTAFMHSWRDEAYYRSDPWRGTWAGEGGGAMVSQSSHLLDMLLWFMGDVDEVYGVWKNYNHPYIEVEDTAVAVIKFKNGALGNIIVSNSQNPGLYGKVHVFGSNGASIGVQTDGGSMFIAGMTSVAEPPFNDLWTVKGEEDMLEKWRREDEELFSKIDFTTHYHLVQIDDFLSALAEGRRPLVTGEDGRKCTELFEAVFRSTETGLPVKFPLK